MILSFFKIWVKGFGALLVSAVFSKLGTFRLWGVKTASCCNTPQLRCQGFRILRSKVSGFRLLDWDAGPQSLQVELQTRHPEPETWPKRPMPICASDSWPPQLMVGVVWWDGFWGGFRSG